MGASAAMARSSSQQSIKLYQVVIQNLDGSIKTVIKSAPFGQVDASGSMTKLFNGVVSCVELTEDMLDALWLSALSDAREDIDTLSTSVIRNMNLFLSKANNKPECSFPAELDLNHAKHIACCLFAAKVDFIPPSEYPDINADVDAPELIAEKRILRRQYSLSAPFEVLDAALNSDSAVVEAFLKVNVGYLVYRGSATDFSGREYKNITPFQAAIIGGNIELAKKMEVYFKNIPDGLDIMNKQKRELYKKDLANYSNTSQAQSIDNPEQFSQIYQQEQQEKAFSFDEIIQAINKASKQELEDIVKNPDKTKDLWSFSETSTANPLIDALNQFRARFQSKALSEIIPSLKHLIDCHKAYSAQFHKWTGDDDTKWLKRDLMARHVISFVQRFLSAHEAQALAQRYNATQESKSPAASFKYRYENNAFYPLTNDFSDLGFAFVCLIGFTARRVPAPGGGFSSYLEKLHQEKITYLESLYPSQCTYRKGR